MTLDAGRRAGPLPDRPVVTESPWWPALADVAIAVLVAGGSILGATLVWRWMRPDAAQLDTVLFILVASGIGMALAVLATLARRPPSRMEIDEALRRARSPVLWGMVVATALATFVLTHVLLLAASAAGIEATPGNNPLLGQLVAEHALLLALFVVGVAPLVEETLFRRVLFGRFLAAGRPWPGALLSGAAFAVAHEPWRSDPLQWLLLLGIYATMGIALCMLYRHTRSLLAPIAAHALHNALALGVLLFVVER